MNAGPGVRAADAATAPRRDHPLAGSLEAPLEGPLEGSIKSPLEAAPLEVRAAEAGDRAAWDAFVAASPRAELYHEYAWRPLLEDVFGSQCHYLIAGDANGAASGGSFDTAASAGPFDTLASGGPSYTGAAGGRSGTVASGGSFDTAASGGLFDTAASGGRTGKVRGVLPLVCLDSRLFGRFLVSLPYLSYGSVLADAPHARGALLEAAVRLARTLDAAHIELRERAGADVGLHWPRREDKVTMVLQLPDSEEALWRAFTPKLRAQIRRAGKVGARCRAGGAELVDDFYAVFARNMRDLGTPVYPSAFFRAVAETFAPETTLHVVELGGRPVAAGLVLARGECAEIPWASSLRAANRYGVNMLLYWSVLRECIARGCRSFDFGRSTHGSGTYRFKAQWGAAAAPLRWHYWLRDGGEVPMLTPSNPRYRAAIALWKRLPMPVANWLGPKIVKHLP